MNIKRVLITLSCLISFPALGQVLEASKVDMYSQTVEESNLDKFHRRAVKSIEAYKPIYITYGEPNSKIQFSFRSQLLRDMPLNFAFTQIIFWRLSEESKPFDDATYNPEFFYRWNPNGEKWNAIDFGIWDHNSNGRAGALSRSYDQSYVRGIFAKEWEKWILFFSPKLKYIYNMDETNKDILDYIGPLEFDLRLVRIVDGFFEKVEMIASLRPGGKFSENLSDGGYQLGLNFKVRNIDLNPTFYLQYYHGYAETLINYDESVDEVRFGLMF